MSREQYAWRRIRCKVCRRPAWALDAKEVVAKDKLRKGPQLPQGICEDCHVASLPTGARQPYINWLNAVKPPGG